jgi:hypothetical protein
LRNSLLRKSFGLLLLHSSEFWFSSLLFPFIVREGSFATPQQLAPTVCVSLQEETQNFHKKRTTANSTRGASSSLDEELNPSTILTQGEELP